MGAHAEAMDDDLWYCSVWRVNSDAVVGSDNETLFHSGEDDIHPSSGPAARRLCELVMRNAVQVRIGGGA